MLRRNALHLLLAVTLLLAGCIGAPLTGQENTDPTPTASPTDAPTETPTATPSDGTPTLSPTPTPPTGTPGDYPHSGAPDADHEIRVENRLERNATFDIRVVREAANETVYDETVTVPPGERVVYNTERAEVDGGESVRIVAERGGVTDAQTIQMTECYGTVIISPEDDGVKVIYSVC
jgi:hypothetical protein